MNLSASRGPGCQPLTPPHLPALLQAVELPQELALLQSLRRLQLEYAQLDSVPASVQVGSPALQESSYKAIESTPEQGDNG